MKPAFAHSSSRARWSSDNFSDGSSMPIQRTRGWPRGGNDPQPSTTISNGSTFVAAIEAAAESSSTRAIGISPRNFSVRCRLSSRLQLARTSRIESRSDLMCSARRARTLPGSSMAMKTRQVSLGRGIALKQIYRVLQRRSREGVLVKICDDFCRPSGAHQQ